MNQDFAYDTIRYPAQVYPKLHPSRLGAIARLHGVQVASPKACRLLEVGCGDGLSLVTMAMAYPDSQFVGVDLSQAAIARGNKLRMALGLDNLELLDVDLLSWDPGEAPFDFVIAHGFYSWVPQAVRDRLLALCKQTLAPSGLACISYNALPGCHMRRMLWDMLKFHSGGAQDPVERITRAQEFMDLLKLGLPADSLYATTMQGEIDGLNDRLDPNVLFHDDLAETNDPCTLDHFVRHAREHELSFVAEANYHEMSTRTANEQVRPLLEQIARDDLVAKEQYLDFFTGRRFRQTILCRSQATPSPSLDQTAIDTLEFSSNLQPDPSGPGPDGRMRFSLHTSGNALTDNKVIQSILKLCAEIYPQQRGVEELLDAAVVAAGDESDRTEVLENVRQFIARAFEVGLVELHCDAPGFAERASAHPCTSPLARLQLEAGETRITSLRPSMTDMSDFVTRKLLLASNGQRNRAEILAFVAQSLANAVRDGEATDNVIPSADELDVHLDANLQTVAKLGLLVAE